MSARCAPSPAEDARRLLRQRGRDLRPRCPRPRQARRASQRRGPKMRQACRYLGLCCRKLRHRCRPSRQACHDSLSLRLPSRRSCQAFPPDSAAGPGESIGIESPTGFELSRTKSAKPDAVRAKRTESKIETRSLNAASEGGDIDGVTDGFRTRDSRNHNPALYQLSYGHQKGAAKHTRPALARKRNRLRQRLSPDPRRPLPGSFDVRVVRLARDAPGARPDHPLNRAREACLE